MLMKKKIKLDQINDFAKNSIHEMDNARRFM